jgi:hypothetical protein
MQVRHQEGENLNAEAEEEFHVEDFMLTYLMKPGLGRICDYCNISKGRSMVFSSMDRYADHWYENHKEFDIYASDKDLDRFFKQFKEDYRKKLRGWQRQHLKQGITWLAWK